MHVTLLVITHELLCWLKGGRIGMTQARFFYD
jgi:hypothetical protein